MQDTTTLLYRTNCANCGKPVPKRDMRDRKSQFCGRICAGLLKYSTRYRGSDAGPFDRPVDMMTKTKWQGSKGDGLVSDIPTGA